MPVWRNCSVRARSVAHQSADLGKITRRIDRRQRVARRQRDDLYPTVDEQASGHDQECIGPLLRQAGKRNVDLAAVAGAEELDLPPDGRSCRLQVLGPGSAFGSFGLKSAAKRAAPGSSSCSSPSRLVPVSTLMALIPVTLPPGRLRLATRPSWTGSPPVRKTIGIVVVAALAASTDADVPGVTMTATRRRTRSAANSGSRCGFVLRPAVFDRHVVALGEAWFAEACAECRH